MLKPKLVTAPDHEVVSLADLKRDLRILEDDFDASLLQGRARAIAYIDGYSGILGKAIGHQVWEQAFPAFTPMMRLPLGPIVSLDSVTYLDTNEEEQTAPDGMFLTREDHRGPYLAPAYGVILPSALPTEDSVKVTWTAGMHATGDPVDARISAAVTMLVGHFHLFPDATTIDRSSPAHYGVEDILHPIRQHL